MTPLLVLHRLGDERGGAAWRDALVQDGWEGPWSAPDQPGHADAPWEADFYEPAHLVMAPLRHLHEIEWSEPPVVLAVGVQSTAAVLLAVGGRAAAIVLVDEPKGPWPEAAEEIQRAEYEWLRVLADDPEAQAPAPQGRTDPRTRHGCTPRHDPDFTAKQRAAISVPVLELDASEPPDVLATVRSWWDCQPNGR
ncbi:MAG: hypothetical protein QOD92_2477 [Acidimicrobiaceae bacterium]